MGQIRFGESSTLSKATAVWRVNRIAAEDGEVFALAKFAQEQRRPARDDPSGGSDEERLDEGSELLASL